MPDTVERTAPEVRHGRREWRLIHPDDLELARRTLPATATTGAAEDLRVWALHARLQRTGDAEALHHLVVRYERYAGALAHRYHRGVEPLEDIRQVALEALVGALRRFDVNRGLPFPAFARPTIVGSLKRHYRDKGWALRTPRAVHDLAGHVNASADRLAQDLQREPSDAEIADDLGVTTDEVVDVREAVRIRRTASLDAAPDELAPTLGDRLGAFDPGIALVEDRAAATDAIAHLSGAERELVQLYYVAGLTQRQIAACHGVSQMQISRRLAATVASARRIAAR